MQPLEHLSTPPSIKCCSKNVPSIHSATMATSVLNKTPSPTKLAPVAEFNVESLAEFDEEDVKLNSTTSEKYVPSFACHMPLLLAP